MRIGLVFDIREDYGLEASDVTFCDFNYLSDMQYLQNTLEQSGHYVLPVGSPHSFARMLREDKLKDIDIIMNFVQKSGGDRAGALRDLSSSLYRE